MVMGRRCAIVHCIYIVIPLCQHVGNKKMVDGIIIPGSHTVILQENHSLDKMLAMYCCYYQNKTKILFASILRFIVV